jgi:hypothetical protein
VSLLHDYIELTEGTEVPELFNVWGGFVLISSSISRRVWLMHGRDPIYANIYAILVGDAGNGKSMAIGDVRELLTEIDNIPIAASIETPEGLLRRLAGRPDKDPPEPYVGTFKTRTPTGVAEDVTPVTIIASEFVNFINKAPENWIHLLNDIYDTDKKFSYFTKNQGQDTIHRPYLVLFGALTTETSFDMVKSRIIQSGFARRSIFQYGERRFDQPCPFPPGGPHKLALRESIIRQCRALQALAGEFLMPKATREAYTAWYNEHSRKCPTAPPHLRSWLTSKPMQVLKLSMLSSLSFSHDLEILPEHLRIALDFLGKMEESLYGIFGGAGRNELAGVAVKIATYLKQQDQALPIRLVQNNFFAECKPPNDFHVCVTHLISQGEASTHNCTLNGTATTYIGTPLIMHAFKAANQPEPPPESPSASAPEHPRAC